MLSRAAMRAAKEITDSKARMNLVDIYATIIDKAMEDERIAHRQAGMESIQQRCQRTLVQCCPLCNSLTCGNNTNPLVKAGKEMKRALDLTTSAMRPTNIVRNAINTARKAGL